MTLRRRKRAEQLGLRFRQWGGARRGAGRPKKVGAGVARLRRPSLNGRWPVHVTMKLRRGLPNLRRPQLFRVLRGAFFAGRERFGGRLCHFSVQGDHVHLLVEASDKQALSLAMQGLAIRMAKAVNRLLQRHGKIFADRYHQHVLRTPAEVRNALAYMLDNRWKHGRVDPDYFAETDYCSSESWPALVVSARSWLLQQAERACVRAGPRLRASSPRRLRR